MAQALEMETRHSSCWCQFLEADTRRRLTGTLVQAGFELALGIFVSFWGSSWVWIPLIALMTKEGLLWPKHSNKDYRMTTLMAGWKKTDKGGHCSGTRVSEMLNFVYT